MITAEVVHQSTVAKSSALPQKIGFTAAAASAFFGFLYLLGLGINLITSGSVYPSGNDVRHISTIIALLWNLALVILFTTLRWETKSSRAILAELALVFGILVCATSSTSWFLRLTAYPRLLQSAEANLAPLLDPYSPSSLAYALEHLGWGLFFGLACLFAGYALKSRSGMDWLQVSFGITGLLSLAHLVGIVAGSSLLTAFGFIAWGMVLPLACLLLASRFRQELRPNPR